MCRSVVELCDADDGSTGLVCLKQIGRTSQRQDIIVGVRTNQRICAQKRCARLLQLKGCAGFVGPERRLTEHTLARLHCVTRRLVATPFLTGSNADKALTIALGFSCHDPDDHSR